MRPLETYLRSFNWLRRQARLACEMVWFDWLSGEFPA